jgi:hypothetical protein
MLSRKEELLARKADIEQELRDIEVTEQTEIITETVTHFARAMEGKMHMRRPQRGVSWRGASFRGLQGALASEINELAAALERLYGITASGDMHKDAMEECVDVANVAMMLHDRLGARLLELTSGTTVAATE